VKYAVPCSKLGRPAVNREMKNMKKREGALKNRLEKFSSTEKLKKKGGGHMEQKIQKRTGGKGEL